MSGFLWQGRMLEGPDEKALAFESSISVDSRLAPDDVRGSRAHVRMLGKAGLISAEESAILDKTLGEIGKELENGTLVPSPGAEDIHSFIEGTLTERLGDTGRKVHTGRSRNDQVALDERLYLKRKIPELRESLKEAIESLSAMAKEHAETYMPGYTHLQRAQPVTLGHHLLAWGWMLLRDRDRLSDALARIDSMPLGSGALAGSGLPLDREFVARELGFARLTENSMDAVADRDYCVEIVSDIAILMTHLSRFCEEIVLWTTEEFGFASLPERWSTGSSIMPQKKNPDYAELIRGRSGRVFGDLIALLTMMKGLPLAYNRDLQEDKESLFDALDTAFSCVSIFTAMTASMEFRKERMEAAAAGGHSNATDLADYLVRRGLPFRSAHGVSAAVVRECIERACSIEDLTLAELKVHSDLFDSGVHAVLGVRSSVEARNLPGGPAAESIAFQLSEMGNRLSKG